MPLTVRELVIRATVEPRGERPAQEGSAAPKPKDGAGAEEIAERVLDKLRRREER